MKIDMSGDKTTIGHISGGNIQTGANSSMIINKTNEKDNETRTLGGEKPPRVKKGEKILIIIGLLTLIVTIIGVCWSKLVEFF